MRKFFTGLIMAVLILSVSLTAYAAESGAAVTLNEETQENSVAVVVDWGAPSTAASPVTDIPAQSYTPVEAAQSSYSPVPAVSGYGYAVGIYPQNVETVTENGVTIIKKTFEVSPEMNPEALAQPFEQDGHRFSRREILRRDLPGETLSRLAFKTAETETDTDDDAVITRQFPGVIEHEEDGYSGQLQLDASTLATAASGHSSYSYAYTKAREISGLERNDPSYIDRQWNGMTLVDVSFKQGANGLYTATAIYKGTATGKKATGYVSTVTYFGTLTKEVPGNVVYTVIYEGAPIEVAPEQLPIAPSDDTGADEEASGDDTPEPSVKEKKSINPFPIAASVIFLIGAVFVPLYTTKELRKQRRQNREAFEEIKRFIRGED